MSRPKAKKVIRNAIAIPAKKRKAGKIQQRKAKRPNKQQIIREQVDPSINDDGQSKI